MGVRGGKILKAFLTLHPLMADAPNKPRQGEEEPQLLRTHYVSGALHIISHVILTRLLRGVLKRGRLRNRKAK